ncbi:uncharacterized protein LOC125312515 [Rhodamnia argentea]|uniref:Uncharacterized protein LOC125312515 n=1 Tax=Rhodamnia argentea TaxID=178133 RepID=A0A8B8P6L0_9MYRT|nr:uncharacterized protein LOC125312515 [Rhodamnia argentea]XP_048133640.1 uncharacterized protein LOC125312515 [Rhodamnia argentea]XP_048133641.1 uncharacterized protein LOC125312515 [Rhodamnia argentea]
MPEQADSFVKTRNGLINSRGGDVNLLETGRDRKGCRACYMCGSLHHLIRNCPHACTPRPRPQRGNAFFADSISPFGNATPLLHARPFVDQGVNFGMMPLNTAVPMYMPTIYGGLPAYGGFTRLGSMAPVVGVGTGPNHSFQELNDIHNREKQWELPKKYMTRDTSTDFGVDDGFMKRCHLVDGERCEKEDGLSYSDDSFSQKPQRKHRHGHNLDSDILWTDERREKTSHSSTSARDGRLYRHEGISSPEAEDTPSCFSRRAKERHYHRNKESRMRKENKAQFLSDSSWSHCQAEKRKDVKRKREESNVKRHDRKPCSSELDCAHKSPSDKENRMRDKKSSHRPSESRHDGRSMNGDLIHNRWKMVSGDEYSGGRPRHYKRNKVL